MSIDFYNISTQLGTFIQEMNAHLSVLANA